MQNSRRHNGLSILIMGMLLCLASGCSESTYTSGSASSPPPITAKAEAGLKKTVDDYMTAAGYPAGIPGVIVGIKMNGYQPWFYASGSAEINPADNSQVTAMKADMPFRIASVTKMFVAHTVLLLAREGKIDLNKTVNDYLPGALTGPNAANASKITVSMLLNHSSGLYSYITSDAGLLNGNPMTPGLLMDQFVLALGQTAWTHSYIPQDTVLTFVNSFTPPTSIKVPVFNNVSSIGNPYLTNPYFAPGAGYHYSNTNYYLLGLIIEKVTGKSVDSEIDRLIVKPLGLTDTYLPTAKTFSSTYHVHGYTDYFNGAAPYTAAMLQFRQSASGWYNGDKVLEDFSYIDPSFTWTTGGMISSAKDLLTFTEHVMKTRVQTGGEAGKWIIGSPISNSMSFQYGRGIARLNDVMFGHGGQFAGYNTAIYWYAPLDLYMLVMTNKYSYLENEPNELGQSLLGGAGGLYKTAAGTAGDPNTGIINGLLDVLTSEAGAKGRKVAPFRFPDISGYMR